MLIAFPVAIFSKKIADWLIFHILVPVFALVTTRSFFFLVVEGGWYLLFRGTSKCEYRPVHQDGEFLAKCSSRIISILCFIFVLKVALLFQLFNFVESYFTLCPVAYFKLNTVSKHGCRQFRSRLQQEGSFHSFHFGASLVGLDAERKTYERMKTREPLLMHINYTLEI